MKYFTLDWWTGIQEMAFSDPSVEYQKHLSGIRDQLPKDLLLMVEDISLHDARLREMKCSIAVKTVEMKLGGGDGRHGLRHIHLRYVEVASFHTSADPRRGLNGPHGYGDWGYDEVDITPDGKFEHRILFSSGIEFQIVFGGFELSWKDAA